MKNLFKIILLLAGAALMSCDPAMDSAEPVTVNSDYCVYSSLPPALMDVIERHFTGARVGCGSASAVFVDYADIRSEDILEAYGRGAVIIAVSPPAELLPLMREWGIDGLSAGTVSGCLLVSFHIGGAVYSVKDISDLRPEDNCLDGLAGWINGIETASNSSSSDEIFQAAHIYASHTVNINNAVIITQRGGKQTYKMSGTGYFEQTYSIIPLYAFPTSSGNSQGDYYIVDACFSVISSDMYHGINQVKVGGNKPKVNGFFLKSLTVEVTLTDSKGKTVDTEFYQLPAPSTTVGSTTYTSGSSWSINGGFAFGTPGVTASASGSYTWSSSKTRVVRDLAIKNDSEHSGLVKYSLEVKNLPSRTSMKVPPMISRGTLDFHTGWVWNVKSAKEFDSSTRYKMKVRLVNLTYTTGTDSNYPASTLTFPFSKDFTFDLPVPNRIPSGRVILSNSEAGTYMKDVVFTSATDSKKRYPDKSGSIYAQGESCTMILPEGKYKLEFNLGSTAYASPDSVHIAVPRISTLNLQSGGYDSK